MTYNVFGGTLKLIHSLNSDSILCGMISHPSDLTRLVGRAACNILLRKFQRLAIGRSSLTWSSSDKLNKKTTVVAAVSARSRKQRWSSVIC